MNAVYWFCNLNLLYPYHFFVPLDLSYMERSILTLYHFFLCILTAPVVFCFIKIATDSRYLDVTVVSSLCVAFRAEAVFLCCFFYGSPCACLVYLCSCYYFFGLSQWISQWKDLLCYDELPPGSLSPLIFFKGLLFFNILLVIWVFLLCTGLL